MGKKCKDQIPPTEEYDKGGPSRAFSGCSQDAYIRSFGWFIRSRPVVGEPIWERNGEKLKQSLVLHKIKVEIAMLEQ